MRGSGGRQQVVSKRGRVRKEPERLEAGPASKNWSSTTRAGADGQDSGPSEPCPTRKRSKLIPSTPRKSTTPEGFRARQLATSELNGRQLELLGLYTKMFPVQAAEDPDCMIETVSTSTSFVIRHGKTREVLAGISFKTFANQNMATVEYITTTVQHVGHGTALLDTLYDHMQKTGQHEGMMLYAYADLEAVEFFHKQGFRPVDDADCADVTARLAAHGVVEPTPSKLMFTSVENQLFVGQVREAEAQAQALGPELVGQRVEVYWSGENVWFPGHVAAYKAQERIHYVIYDDGESVWERLTAKDCKALGPGPARAQLDTTVCAICNGNGTVGPLYGPFDSNRRGDLYVHEHCIMFNSCVRLVGGALRGVGDVIAAAKKASCKLCRKKGASVTCAHEGCKAAYHYECCKSDESCYFQSEQYEFFCPTHTPRTRRKSTRQAGGPGENAGSAGDSGGQHRSLFGTAFCEMLMPAARSSAKTPPTSSHTEPVPAASKTPAQAAAQNNGTNGGWTVCEDRCLAAIMEAAKPNRPRPSTSRVGYSWNEISSVVARSIDSACKRSENSCRHRWNKIAGIHKPTAAEQRRAHKLLESLTDDESDRPVSSTATQSGSGAKHRYDVGGIAVRECQQKVIVADDEGSDADNDVVEVVSVGVDIKLLPEPKPGYGYARASARPPRTTARDGRHGVDGEATVAPKRRATATAAAARNGSRARQGVAARSPPHPPAAIVRSPAQHLKERAAKIDGKHIRRSGGTGGREVRIHVVGSGGNCRICRNGRGVCRKRGAPGHLPLELEAENQDVKADGGNTGH